MTTAEIVELLIEYRDTIRSKIVEFGLVGDKAKYKDIAAAVSKIIKYGGLSEFLYEGDVYVIPKGYHDGTSTIAVAEGEGVQPVGPVALIQPLISMDGYTLYTSDGYGIAAREVPNG